MDGKMQEVLMELCIGNKSDQIQKQFLVLLIRFAKKQNKAQFKKQVGEELEYSEVKDFKTVKKYFNYIYINVLQSMFVSEYYDFLEKYYDRTDDIGVFLFEEIDTKFEDILADNLAKIF